MQPLRKKWLESDYDATLTVESMKLYEDNIKFGGRSVEQNLIARHVNHLLWDDLHDLKQHIFNIPVSTQLQSELADGLAEEFTSVARSVTSEGPTRNATVADSKFSSKIDYQEKRLKGPTPTSM